MTRWLIWLRITDRFGGRLVIWACTHQVEQLSPIILDQLSPCIWSGSESKWSRTKHSFGAGGHARRCSLRSSARCGTQVSGYAGETNQALVPALSVIFVLALSVHLKWVWVSSESGVLALSIILYCCTLETERQRYKRVRNDYKKSVAWRLVLLPLLKKTWTNKLNDWPMLWRKCAE